MIAGVQLDVPDGLGEPRPIATLRVRDPIRRRHLERALANVAVLQPDLLVADVLVLDLRPGEALPPDAAAFDGAILALSDDAAHASDTALAGVLPAGAGERQVAAAVAAVAEGLVVRAQQAREAPGFAPREPPARALLTPREVEVLALVGQGQSNKAIARRLGISAHTVKYHLEAIFAKLGVRSRAEAVTRGLRLGVQVF
jgi:DNA-binding NarL/FixJ family response regulator